MNARISVGDPGAAHSAKTATAPGLPNQTANDSKGRTPMVPRDIFAEAAQRTAYRPGLVAAPVAVIVRRWRDGESLTRITRYLQAELGPDNQAATPEFVQWVVARAGGEAR